MINSPLYSPASTASSPVPAPSFSGSYSPAADRNSERVVPLSQVAPPPLSDLFFAASTAESSYVSTASSRSRSAHAGMASQEYVSLPAPQPRAPHVQFVGETQYVAPTTMQYEAKDPSRSQAIDKIDEPDATPQKRCDECGDTITRYREWYKKTIAWLKNEEAHYAVKKEHWETEHLADVEGYLLSIKNPERYHELYPRLYVSEYR